MEITLDLIVFTVLAVFTLASAVLAVTTKRILRAATFLLFVLFGTAGIYFQLNYSFLGAVWSNTNTTWEPVCSATCA